MMHKHAFMCLWRQFSETRMYAVYEIGILNWRLFFSTFEKQRIFCVIKMTARHAWQMYRERLELFCSHSVFACSHLNMKSSTLRCMCVHFIKDVTNMKYFLSIDCHYHHYIGIANINYIKMHERCWYVYSKEKNENIATCSSSCRLQTEIILMESTYRWTNTEMTEIKVSHFVLLNKIFDFRHHDDLPSEKYRSREASTTHIRGKKFNLFWP